MAEVKFHRDMARLPKDTVIWRYYSLPKFMWLLENQKIFMCRADKFSDKGEMLATEKDAMAFKMPLEEWSKYLQREKERTFISCWIISNHEQNLMWETYTKNDGIAIKTTIGDLINSCHPDEGNNIYVGAVHYIDPSQEGSHKYGERLNILRVPFVKRIYFEQEREFRMVYTNTSGDLHDNESIPCDIRNLIKELYVGLNPSDEFLKHICDLVQFYGLSCKVQKSAVTL